MTPNEAARVNPPEQIGVLAFLADPANHPGVIRVERIDTHGAIVFLAGPDVYKIKRAVRFPFMDFSSLEKRRAACEAEMIVNRENAPSIYLGVTPITRSQNGLALGGAGEIVEWAAHMRRFDESLTFDHLVEAGALTPELIGALAGAIVASHARAPRRTQVDFARGLETWIIQNDLAFAAEPAFFDEERRKALFHRSQGALMALRPTIEARTRACFVRRCHGDLHLGNIALVDGAPLLFDAIEFDEGIATGDVMYDLAFPLMDLAKLGLAELANLLFNRYLWTSDDPAHYRDLALIPLFLSIRAAIRAKVVFAGAKHRESPAREAALGDAARYFDMACVCLAPTRAKLIAVGGLSGSGKSALSGKLAPALGCIPGAVWLRSDIERKMLYGVAETERLPPEAYAPAATAKVYARLRDRAALSLKAGHCVVVDAVHARADERAAIEAVATAAGVSFVGLWLDAAMDIRTSRVSARVGDASDANAAIARDQAHYDIGEINWRRVDAARPLATLAEEVIRDL